MKEVQNCPACKQETYNTGLCYQCLEHRKRNPKDFCQCGRGKYWDAVCCDVCWNSGY